MSENLGSFFSSGGSNAESKSFTDPQYDVLNKTLNTYAAQMGKGQNVYSGQRVAGLNPSQQQALDLQGWSNYLAPGNMPLYGETGTALSGVLSGQAGASPYTSDAVNTLFRAAYERPAMKQWQKYLQPTIRESYSGPGFWGTSRMRAEQEGAQNVSDTLTNQYGQLMWAADQANKAIEEAKASRALAAVQPGLAYGQTPTTQAITAIQGRGALAGVASMEQQQRQNEINANIQKFIEENRLTDPESLQALMGLLNMNYNVSESDQAGAGIGYGMALGMNSALSNPGESIGSMTGGAGKPK